jgi:hypothetical protein
LERVAQALLGRLEQDELGRRRLAFGRQLGIEGGLRLAQVSRLAAGEVERPASLGHLDLDLCQALRALFQACRQLGGAACRLSDLADAADTGCQAHQKGRQQGPSHGPSSQGHQRVEGEVWQLHDGRRMTRVGPAGLTTRPQSHVEGPVIASLCLCLASPVP